MSAELPKKASLKNLEDRIKHLEDTTVTKADLEIFQRQLATFSKRNEALEENLEQAIVQKEQFEATLNNQWQELMGMFQNTISQQSLKENLDQERQLMEVWVKALVQSEIDLHANALKASAPTYQPPSEHLNDLRTMIEVLHDLCRVTLFCCGQPASKKIDIPAVRPTFERTPPRPSYETQPEEEEKPYWMSEEEDQRQREFFDTIQKLLNTLKEGSIANTPVDEFWQMLSSEQQMYLARAFTQDPERRILQTDISLTKDGREWLSGLYSYVKLIVDMAEDNQNDQPF